MNLRATLLAVALAAAGCSLPVPPQFACPSPGDSTGCGTNEICGPDHLCTSSIAKCAANELRCPSVCVDVTHNRENCGKCGTVCAPSEQCLPDANNQPTCTPFCAAGQTACAQPTGGFICKNLSGDRSNCGACGKVCGQGLVCSPS